MEQFQYLYLSMPRFFIDGQNRLTCDLSSKQDTLTASAGIVLNGSTISVDAILLDAKQDELTISEGIYINQTSSGVGNLKTTIRGYRLRYQTTGLNQLTPSSNVQTLKFKDFIIS